MTVMKKTEQKDDAVSPVVGVMLMLVVTIIIAAVVAAFAGGLATDTEVPPTASLETKISINPYGNVEMVIQHLGGDPIDTARTKLVTTWTDKETRTVYSKETLGLSYSSEGQVFNSTNNQKINLDLSTANVNYVSSGVTHIYNEPYFVIPGETPTSSLEAAQKTWYGNFVLSTGETMKVSTSGPDYGVNNLNADKTSAIKHIKDLSDKDVVTVQLIDVPSGQLIYEEDVYVRG